MTPYKRWLRIQMGVQLWKEQEIVQFHHLLFYLGAIFFKLWGCKYQNISFASSTHSVSVWHPLFLWTMRRTSCVYGGEAAEGVKHCLQGIVCVCVCVYLCMWETDEVSCRSAASLPFQYLDPFEINACIFSHHTPSTTEMLLLLLSAATGKRRKSLSTWFQSQNLTKKKKKRENPVTADCKRPHNWHAGAQRARLLSDQPRRRTARATHCRE